MKHNPHILAPAALILSILQLQLLTPTLSLYAAVPLRWTVETSRVQPAVFEAIRGESLYLEAALQSNGKPLAVTDGADVRLLWQTNGMDRVFWSTNAVLVSSNVIAATFLPSFDPGASSVTGFLGIPGSNYRAAFQLRFRHGPGAVPNVIEQPPPVLDLAHTVVVNPPWPTDQTIDARIRQVIAADDITANVPTGMVRTVVSNTVTKAYVESLGISGGGSSIDTNTVIDIATSVVAPAVNAAVNTGRAITASAAAAGTNYTDTVASLKSDKTNTYTKAEADRLLDRKVTGAFTGIHGALPDGTDYYIWGSDGTNAEAMFTDASGVSRDVTLTPFPIIIQEGGVTILGITRTGANELLVANESGFNRHALSSIVGALGFRTAVETVISESDAKLPTSKAVKSALAAKADSADVSSLSSQVSGLASSKADSADLDPIRTAANDALAYGRGVFMYLNGTTNCYFSGTNYVIGAESTNRTAFALEDGMDLASVPCSMALWEIRDGTRQCVWDQRDWTVWYWNFKIAQYRIEHDGRDAALRALIEGKCPLNWASYTACGLTNAAGDTTWIDTPKVVLSAGYAWQHQLTVDGVGYWGIQGNGFEVGGSGTNSTLRITDWEGNEVLKITKGSARLAYLTSGSGVASGFDGGWMWYDMMCDAQPTGEFTVDLLDTFVEEGDGCPAEVREYVDRGNGVWRCYFRARPGINATACFARFKVQVGTETTVEYGTAPTVPGLIVNGRKIAPVIPANAQVGDTVTWKVVQ